MPPPECAGKSPVRNLGVIPSEHRSPGSFKDWKDLRAISGEVVKTKALKSGRCTYLLVESGGTRTSSPFGKGGGSPEPHPLLAQGQHRRGIMK